MEKEIKSLLAEDREDVQLGIPYQNKLIHVFCEDRTGFSETIIDIIDSKYFDGYQQILVEHCLKYYNDRSTVIRFDSLRDRISFREKGLTKDALLGLIDKIEKLKIEDKEEIQVTSHGFFKRRAYRDVILKAAGKWSKGDNLEEISKDFEDALKAGEPKDSGHDYFRDKNKRLSKSFRLPIPCMEGLNDLIDGGLSSGELGVIIAPPGGGKSMALVKFASTALLAGKNVVYYTMELSEEVVGQRFDACINDIKLKNVWDYPEHIGDKLDELQETGGGLKIKEFLEGGTTVNTIKAHLKTLEIEGFVPDVIFVDYLGLMKPLGSYAEMRHALTDITESLRNIANNYRIPVWTAHQTNRTAIGEEIIGAGHIGESLGIIATADLVIGIGRPDKMKEDNKAMMGIIKNRNGQDGVYKLLEFDTSRVYIAFAEEAADALGLSGGQDLNEPGLEELADFLGEQT